MQAIVIILQAAELSTFVHLLSKRILILPIIILQIRPFDVQYILEPYVNAKFSFSLGTPVTPTCNQTSNVWSTFYNNDAKACSDAKNEDPAFTAVGKNQIFSLISERRIAYDTAFPGVVITYPAFEGGQGNLKVTLRCNKTAPHDTNVDFFVHKWENSTFYLTGYSYYGK